MKKQEREQLKEKLNKNFLIEQYIDLRKSSNIIAKRVVCSNVTILNYLKKHNIEIRNNSEAQKGHKHTEETKNKMGDGRRKGKNNLNFKGRTKDGRGYIYINSYNHPNKDHHNNMFEHRLIIESQIGKYLNIKWEVHHINGIRDDNRPENLICFISKSAHQRFHKDPNNVKESEIIFDGRKIKERNEGN